jgi:hypothetical protein
MFWLILFLRNSWLAWRGFYWVREETMTYCKEIPLEPLENRPRFIHYWIQRLKTVFSPTEMLLFTKLDQLNQEIWTERLGLLFTDYPSVVVIHNISSPPPCIPICHWRKDCRWTHDRQLCSHEEEWFMSRRIGDGLSYYITKLILVFAMVNGHLWECTSRYEVGCHRRIESEIYAGLPKSWFFHHQTRLS